MRSRIASMAVYEPFLTAVSNLGVHKMRTTLTMLGIIFGVGAVIAMLSIGAGAEKQALESIGSLGVRGSSTATHWPLRSTS